MEQGCTTLLPQAIPAICSLFIGGSSELAVLSRCAFELGDVGAAAATEWPESRLPLLPDHLQICPDCKFQILSGTEAPSTSTTSAPESNTPKDKLLLLHYKPPKTHPKNLI